MRLLVVALASGLVYAFAPIHTAAPLAGGRLVPAHSHWDGPNGNFELKACYTPSAEASGAASTIAYMPFRAQNAKSYMQLSLTTAGYALLRRVAGRTTIIKPDFGAVKMPFKVGSEMMFDLVASGADYTLYRLNGNLARGSELYHWHDSTFARGTYISYYTQPRWAGTWDFVHVLPSDNGTVKHDVLNLVQDARNRPASSGGATFDASVPASGDQSGIKGVQQTFGLPSGANYTYTFNVTGTGTGHVDFRDPASSSGAFFVSGYYRLNLGRSAPTIERIAGKATVVATYRGTGSGPGIYVLKLQGSSMDLSKAGQNLLHVNDGGAQSGVRLRVVPARGQTWGWSGEALP
jgi:hypothetical protein